MTHSSAVHYTCGSCGGEVPMDGLHRCIVPLPARPQRSALYVEFCRLEQQLDAIKEQVDSLRQQLDRPHPLSPVDPVLVNT